MDYSQKTLSFGKMEHVPTANIHCSAKGHFLVEISEATSEAHRAQISRSE